MGRVGLVTGCVLVAAGIGLLVAIKLRPIPSGVEYVGSASCESCHREQHAAWAISQHQKMMRPIDEPGVLVASFGSDHRDLRFEREEAVWAIGGKWEQQFMGRDGAGETLLPGAWLVHAERWKLVGWDGWEKPVPLSRCHGCHTVGLDVESGDFVEPNIGCESCHGPGGWHAGTFGLGRIHSSADVQICGQCHTRGTTPSGEFHFPVGYRPGADLSEHFREWEASPGQNSSYWWGNGHERRRHQEYIAWRRGGHANSLKSLLEDYDGRYGELSQECLECHAGDYVLAGRRKPELEAVRHGITCSVCHNVHGDLDALRMDCSACHGEGAFHHEPERNAGHVACPEEARVGCVGCHMPVVVENGGAYTLHSHSPGVVRPTSSLQYGMPNSCANGGCHATTPPEQLQEMYEAHYEPPASRQAAGGT